MVFSEAEFRSSNAREQQAVLAKWHQLPPESTKRQTKKEIFNDDILRLRSHHSKEKVDKLKDKEDHASYVRTSETSIVAPVPRSAAFTYAPEALQQIASYDGEELEKAIQESVKVTSKGNPDQDRLIERAIRASVSELRYMAINPSTQEEGEEPYQQAIGVSMMEDGRTGGQQLRSDVGGPSVAWAGVQGAQPDGGIGGSWLTDDPELEQALHKSLTEQGVQGYVEEDKLEKALRDSRHRLDHGGIYQNTPEVRSEENDEEFLKVVEESRKLDEERETKRLEEEQFVMEYVMKASLEEQ